VRFRYTCLANFEVSVECVSASGVWLKQYISIERTLQADEDVDEKEMAELEARVVELTDQLQEATAEVKALEQSMFLATNWARQKRMRVN
jgi:predicted transcriptional regulator